MIDKQTCHKQIKVTSEGRGLCLSSEDCCVPNEPLRFDQLYCALGSVAITSGQHYWEVDVHCCPSWAVGVAYGSLQRRGRDKGAKLGRNRCSWSLEFQNGHLLAWHNDRHVALPVTAARAAKQSRGVCKVSEGPSGVLWCWDYENATGVFSSANGCVWKSTSSVYWASLPSIPLFFTQRQRPSSYENMRPQSLIIISNNKNNKVNKQYLFQAEIFCNIVLEHYWHFWSI